MCTFCNSTYIYYRNLVHHIKVCHSDSLKCAMSTYTFKPNEELEKHIEVGHSDIEKETFKANTHINDSQIADSLIEDMLQ